MADPIDYYDVQAMIRDARSEIRGEISNAVEEANRERRAAVDELREQIAALERVIQSRTDHLA